MTREELKAHCERQIEMCEFWAIGKGEKPSGKVYEEHKLILELLEQEPCEDAVSRKAVDRLVWEYLRKATDESIAFYEHFLDLPSVTPIRPKGHWISHREHCENLGVMPSGLGAYEWCSNCDCGIDVMEWHRNNYNYCPNCGCRMVEPKESEGKE